jgi:SsrA-binding protein
MADVARNKQASYRYNLLEKWEAGLVLQGSEVKSLRDGKAQLKDGYAMVRDGEVWLYNVHISPYPPATTENHEPERPRKLLMHHQGARAQARDGAGYTSLSVRGRCVRSIPTPSSTSSPT